MPSGNPALIEFLRETMLLRGPQTFRWFMEQALYHPTLGYYSSGRAAIGRQGDYFTNATVGPFFGKLLGAQFLDMWETLGCPDDFKIVEQGAHHGDFARDMLTAAQKSAPKFFADLRYEIIEPFAALEAQQKTTLTSFTDKIVWRKSLEDLPEFCGVHFSNELLDAMPAHLLALTSDGWKEKYVHFEKGEFELIDGAISTADLQDQLQKLPTSLRPPYETELNLVARDWIRSLAPKLHRGYVLCVDYGYPRAQFFATERKQGTLRCYSKHRVIDSPLAYVGNADITAHVEWTSVAECAEASGLQLAGFADQHHFLTALVASLPNEFENFSPRERRALQTLLHPEMLGTTFQFFALAKDAPENVALSGFSFARSGRKFLEL